jgi:tetratricopeptide (TPR) repeat protein
MISRVCDNTGRIETAISTEAESTRTAIEKQLTEVLKLQAQLYQINGLSWLPRNYFDDHISTEGDVETWKKGFRFELPSIMDKKEFRRCELINEIKNKLEDQHHLLLAGDSGSSKSTLLMEIIIDYFVDGYEIFYNLDGAEIRNGPQLVSFIEDRLQHGDKVLVTVDNVHTERTSAIFYAMDVLESSYKSNKNVRFLLAARIPEYDSLLRRLNQVREGKESIRKFSKAPEFRFKRNDTKDEKDPLFFNPLFFTKDEITGFVEKYWGKIGIILKDSKGKIIQSTVDEEDLAREGLLNTLSEVCLKETNGHPIMVKFYFLRDGLRTDVERKCEDYLNDSQKMQTMLVCALLDLASLPITDKLLSDMGVIREACNLGPVILYQPGERTWKTIHPRWDEELFSHLYNGSDKGSLLDRKDNLKNAINSIFSTREEKTAFSVIEVLYNLAHRKSIPVDVVKDISYVPDFISDETKYLLYALVMPAPYIELGLYDEAIAACDKAIEIADKNRLKSGEALTNKGISFAVLGNYAEAMKCLDKAIEIDPENTTAFYNKGTALEGLSNYDEAIRCYDIVIQMEPKNAAPLINKGHALGQLGKYDEAIRCFDKAIEIDPEDPTAWYNKGVSLSILKEYLKAIECLDKAIGADPRERTLWYRKGVHHTAAFSRADPFNIKAKALDHLGEYDDAIKSYDKVIEIEPRNVEAHYSKGHILGQLGKYDEAIRCFDKAIEIEPRNVDARIAKGLDLDKLHKHEEAIIYYDKALEIKPDNAIAWFAKGLALHYLKRFNEAVNSYNRAIDIKPPNADVWNKKGLALNALGEYYEAIKCYDIVIQMEPKNAAPLIDKGKALLNVGKYDEAIRCFDKAIEIDPEDPTAWYNKGVSLSILKEYLKAIECLDKAIGADPRNPDPFNIKGVSLSSLGRYEEAVRSYDKAIEIDPTDFVLRNNKGLALRRLGKYDEAVECYDKAIGIKPNLSALWFNKGNSLSDSGRYDDAINCYIKAIELDPNNRSSYVQLVECYNKLQILQIRPNDLNILKNKAIALGNLERYDEAIKCCDKVIEIDPNNAGAWNNKGAALINSGKYDEGIKSLDKGLSIDPNNADAWNNKGITLGRLGKHNEAIQCFDKVIKIDPNRADAWYNRACYKIRIADIKDGLADLKKAIDIGKQEYIELATQDENFVSLRDDQEFRKIVGPTNR